MNEINFFYIDEKCKFLMNLNIKEILNAIILHSKRFVGLNDFFPILLKGLNMAAILLLILLVWSSLRERGETNLRKLKSPNETLRIVRASTAPVVRMLAGIMNVSKIVK